MERTPLIWAHRGASGCRPENTLPAFEEAANEHADGIELDVQLTRDGELVVCHDERVDRTSSGIGYVKDFTLAELKKLDFCYGNLNYEGTKIPTMKEVFACLQPTGLTINIELKTGEFFYEGIEEKMVILTHAMGWENRVIYSSFNHYSIKNIQALDPDAKTAFLYCDGTLDMPEYGRANGVTALHPSGYNLQYPDFMKKCQAYGLDVNVWTINRAEDILACANAGVHAIITNYPSKARQVLENQIL